MTTPSTATGLKQAFHSAGAVFEDGSLSPAHFGDALSELRSLTTAAGLVDRTLGTRFEHKGTDALDLLHRLTTNDLLSLGQGRAAGTALTSDRGRVIDVLTVAVRDADRLFLLSESSDAKPAVEWIDRYTIIEDAELKEISPQTAQFALIGPEAPELLAGLSGQRINDGSITSIGFAGAQAELVRRDWPGLPRIDVICAVTDAVTVWNALREAGAAPAGGQAYHTARVIHAVPFPGNELSDRVNPLEAGLERIVSFTKGCYIGQEVIARLDSYDKLQRRLVVLEVVSGKVTPGESLTAAGKKAGEVTSAAELPVDGKRFALGFVRRGSWEPGTELQCGDSTVMVRSVPAAQSAS